VVVAAAAVVGAPVAEAGGVGNIRAWLLRARGVSKTSWMWLRQGVAR
jgi:hypothetical protein